MPITLVKLIDLYVGTLVFALLNVMAALPWPRRVVERPPRRILLVKFWGIGSILLLQPVMRALRRQYPDAEVTLLTLSRNRGLHSLVPVVDRFLTLDLESTAALPFRLFWLAAEVRRRRYDVVVDCEFFAKLAAILTFLSGAPVRVGFYRRERLRQRLYTSGVPFRHDVHVIRAFSELLLPLGVPVDLADHALPPPGEAAEAEVRALLTDVLGSTADATFVAVNPNASELAYERRWPPDRFADLCRRIVLALDLPVLLVGSASEHTYVEAVARAADLPGRVTNVAGRTTLPALQALLRRALLFVTNDSGPLHLAACSGVPCVALFGPETPDLYGPVGDGHQVLTRRLPCSPCMSVHDMKQVVCHGQIDCLTGIPVEEVLERVLLAVRGREPQAVLAS